MTRMTADEFRELRERLGYSQQKLADRISSLGSEHAVALHRVTVANYESGTPIPGPVAGALRYLIIIDGGRYVGRDV